MVQNKADQNVPAKDQVVQSQADCFLFDQCPAEARVKEVVIQQTTVPRLSPRSAKGKGAVWQVLEGSNGLLTDDLEDTNGSEERS